MYNTKENCDLGVIWVDQTAV